MELRGIFRICFMPVTPPTLGTGMGMVTRRFSPKAVYLSNQRASVTVANILVSRDQFNITPEGITHKPSGASFIPDIGHPLSGSIRAGQLEGEPGHGDRYDPETVKRMLRELWAEYVQANPTLFNR